MQAMAPVLEGGPGPGRPVAEESLDGDAILARLDEDRELLVELIGLFFEDCPGWLSEIRAGLRAGDAPRLKLAAHTLRGAASYFRPCATYEAAQDLEALAGAGDQADAAAAAARLEATVACLGPALRRLARQARP